MYDENYQLIPYVNMLVTRGERLQIMAQRYKQANSRLSSGEDYTPSESELRDAAYAKGMDYTTKQEETK